MNASLNEITINGKIYVEKGSNLTKAKILDGMKYCIVRCYWSGVFAGYIEKRDGREVILRNARRIWYWSGAASLSQLAVDGTSDSGNCKFPCEVDEIKILDAIEIIPCTEKSRKSIKEVAVWEK